MIVYGKTANMLCNCFQSAGHFVHMVHEPIEESLLHSLEELEMENS